MALDIRKVKPGDGIFFSEKGFSTTAFLVALSRERVYLSNGYSIEVDRTDCLSTHPVNSTSFVVRPGLFPELMNDLERKLLSECVPGDIVLIFGNNFKFVTIDHILVKDTKNKMFFTVGSRIVLFSSKNCIFSGFSEEITKVPVPDETIRQLQNMYA